MLSFLKPSLAAEKINRLNNKTIIGIYALLGIAILFFHAHTIHLGKVIPVGYIFIFSLLIGPFIGNLSGWIASRLYFALSNNFFLLDEGMNWQDVWKTMAFSNIPLIFAGLLIVIQYFIYGDIVFTKIDIGKYAQTSMLFYYLIEMVKIGLLVWAFIFSICVLSNKLNITIVQALTTNFVSVLVIYGLGRILLFIIVKILT